MQSFSIYGQNSEPKLWMLHLWRKTNHNSSWLWVQIVFLLVASVVCNRTKTGMDIEQRKTTAQSMKIRRRMQIKKLKKTDAVSS